VSGGVRQVVAGIPGARRVAATNRRLSAQAAARLPWGPSREMAGLVRSVQGRDDAEIAVLGPVAPGLVAAIHKASPNTSVTEFPDADQERHLAMTAMGPFDVILDRDVPERRRHRFEATFFQLRPGGTYVIPGGAAELGPRRGPLGELLAAAAAAPTEGLRDRPRPLRENRRLAIKNHVTHRVVGNHLLLSHDVPDVVVKIRESQYNAFLRRVDTAHRVVETIPAEPPPGPAAGIEGPEPRDPRMQRPIARARMSLRDYRDVVVAPRQVLVDGRVLLPDTYRHNQWPVLLNTQLVDLAKRFAQTRVALPDDPPRLAGTYLHLDNEFRGHFGHLLTESLSRVWSWPEALAIDPEAKVLVGATHKRPRPLDYELQLYEACGIPRDRIVVIDGPVRVERLISGTPMFSHPQYVHPRIRESWERAGDQLASVPSVRQWPRRFFVGRRGDKRSCVNGEVVEAIFAEYGFETVYPEDYSLGEQVQLFRGAEVIGGYAGSGLFQIAFVPDPTHVVMVGPMSYTPRNEYLMAAVLGHRLDAVICQADGKGVQASYAFDPEREGPFLRGILDGLP
jgi:capsular polysaccharide biosynthesis protein